MAVASLPAIAPARAGVGRGRGVAVRADVRLQLVDDGLQLVEVLPLDVLDVAAVVVGGRPAAGGARERERRAEGREEAPDSHAAESAGPTLPPHGTAVGTVEARVRRGDRAAARLRVLHDARAGGRACADRAPRRARVRGAEPVPVRPRPPDGRADAARGDARRARRGGAGRAVGADRPVAAGAARGRTRRTARTAASTWAAPPGPGSRTTCTSTSCRAGPATRTSCRSWPTRG